MVDDSAHSVMSTQTRARVDTLLLRPTGMSLRAVGVVDTLWPTAGVWIALREAWTTLADGDGIVVVIVVVTLANAFSIGSTWRWQARVCELRRRLKWWF